VRFLLIMMIVTGACRAKHGDSSTDSPPAKPADKDKGPLLAESFDAAESISTWRRTDGAALAGPGPESKISWDNGAARFDVDTTTRHFVALDRTVPVAGVPWIRMSVRMKSENVSDSGAFHIAYLYARIDNGPPIATDVLVGTHDWTSYARRFQVPAGAKEMSVALVLGLPGTAWFDDVRVEAVEAPAWQEAKVGHYDFHWLPGDAIPDTARAYDEESYKQVSDFLGVPGPASVPFYKYPDNATKDEYTGDPGNARVITGAIHSIFATDRHEIVHVIARGWGDPPALVAEGLAVDLSGAWQGKPVTQAARELIDDKWIPLEDLLDTKLFYKHPDMQTYPIAGAFISWIVATKGKDKLRELYSRLTVGGLYDDNLRVLEEVCGDRIGLVDAHVRGWLRDLDKQPK
jgi:hypothetical protein